MNDRLKIRLPDLIGLFRGKVDGRWWFLYDWLRETMWPVLSLVLMGIGLSVLAYAVGYFFALGWASAWQAAPPNITLNLGIPE